MVGIVRKLAESLTRDEVEILELLSDGKERKIDDIIDEKGWDYARVARVILYLANKDLVEIEEKEIERVSYSEKGVRYLEEDLPEDKLLEILRERREINISEIPLEDDEKKAAIGVLKRMGIIEIKDGKVILLKDVEMRRTEKFRRLSFSEEELKEFLKRGLLEKRKYKIWNVRIKDIGLEVLKTAKKLDLIEEYTRDVLLSGVWREKKFRRYDVESRVPEIYGGRRHPLKELIDLVKEVLISMGFEEVRGPWVEISFWNFDAMFQPQDHPARELHDTIYLKNPSKGEIREKELLERVKKVHEEKWRYKFSEDVTRSLILRTHTTAVTFRMFGREIKVPCKYFCVGRVFRNETIDWKHLAEFHQIEGFIADYGLSLRDLMGFMKEFYKNFGIKKLRFKPTYNPYTEPSMEVFGWHPEVKKWVEIGNSGIFRPEALRPFGLEDVTIIAWGLALERLAMLIYDIEDIREVFGDMVDLEWIRNYEVVGWLPQG